MKLVVVRGWSLLAFRRPFPLSEGLDYVSDKFETMITTPTATLKSMSDELKKETPPPLHTMLEKENRENAIEKHTTRKLKKTTIVPLTCTGIHNELFSIVIHLTFCLLNMLFFFNVSESELQRFTSTNEQSTCIGKKRNAPHCRKCGKPMKGHRPCQNIDFEETANQQ